MDREDVCEFSEKEVNVDDDSRKIINKRLFPVGSLRLYFSKIYTYNLVAL